MRKDKADILVAALRSGDYKQTRGALSKHRIILGITVSKRHCCLGVASELTPGNTRIIDTNLGFGVHRIRFLKRDVPWGTTDYMNDATRDYFGFKTSGGSWVDSSLPPIIGKDGMPLASLAQLNDDGWTFAQIADFIEVNYEHL